VLFNNSRVVHDTTGMFRIGGDPHPMLLGPLCDTAWYLWLSTGPDIRFLSEHTTQVRYVLGNQRPLFDLTSIPISMSI
jgi:hypothetical protein